MSQTIAIDSAQQLYSSMNQPGTNVSAQSISMLDLALKGGWIMIVLAILSIIAVYIFVLKYIEIKNASKDDKSFMDRIQDYMSDDKISSAIKLCDDTNSPYARMIKKGIAHRDHSSSEIRVAIENIANIEVSRLERWLPFLATISAVAPMIGFLGTVIGMLHAFFDMANASEAGVNIQIFSSGIYQALVTTVAGLIVGIITLFLYNFLTSQLDRVINKMEMKSVEFMDVINGI